MLLWIVNLNFAASETGAVVSNGPPKKIILDFDGIIHKVE